MRVAISFVPPQFKYSRAPHLFHSIALDDGDVLHVVGDGDNGAYEWIVCNENGTFLGHSDAGYGSTQIALRDGLIAYHGLPTDPRVRIWSVERQKWWLPHGHGYTKQKQAAGTFSIDEAYEHVASNYGEVPDHVIVPLEQDVRITITKVSRAEVAS